MQKVLKFLEARVEWFAVGIAMIFLGWCAWTYLVNDPAARKLETVDVGPSNVDKFIDEHAAQRLREKVRARVAKTLRAEPGTQAISN